MLQAQAEHGMISAWCPEGLSQIQCQPYIYDILKPYFKISKDCGFDGGCFANSKVLLIDGTYYNASTGGINYGSTRDHWSTFILQDGISVLLQYTPSVVGIYVGIYVDVDNFKGSNTYGKDVFIFHATDDKVVPEGMRTEAKGDALSAYCGRYCAAWVLANENMDYLHCNDLSWNGKTKCK
jgi:hypothetical protein